MILRGGACMRAMKWEWGRQRINGVHYYHVSCGRRLLFSDTLVEDSKILHVDTRIVFSQIKRISWDFEVSVFVFA